MSTHLQKAEQLGSECALDCGMAHLDYDKEEFRHIFAQADSLANSIPVMPKELRPILGSQFIDLIKLALNVSRPGLEVD